MNSQVGIWIDHKDAYLVFVGEGAPEAHHMESGVGKHVRYSGHASEDGSADDQRDRQFAAHLDKYYDEVISHMEGAKSILLFGPGEAKGELKKRLAGKGLGDRIVGFETVDKMTDHQIAAKVRTHFQQ
jgi:hypothetical protein